MATYPTVPAYVTVCHGWEERLKEHPVWAWMFEYEESFDRGNLKTTPFAQNPYKTSDFTYSFNGVTTTGGEPAWNASLQVYSPFTSHFHEPKFAVIFETATGYELIGIANLFANLPVPGEQTKADLSGKKWDVGAPGCFHFKYVKDAEGPGGLKMSEQNLYGDGLGLVAPMVQRGIITAEQVFAGPPKA
jgi:hypothetical protein